METIVVGIDVAKDRLDVAVRPSGEVFAIARNGAGLADLCEKLVALGPTIVAIEATGGFEEIAAAGLAGAGLLSSSSIPPRSAPSPRRSVSAPRPIRSMPPSSPTSPRRPSPRSGRCPTRKPAISRSSSPDGARSSR